MVKQKIPHRSMINLFMTLTIIVSAALYMTVCSVCSAYAVTTTAKTGELTSVIEGMKVRQVGSSQVMLELRGTSVSLPVSPVRRR